MIAHVRAVAEDTPEMSLAAWDSLALESAGRFERGLLLALAEAFPYDVRVASVWDDDERELLGTSIGYLYDPTGTGRQVRTLNHPDYLPDGPICRSVRVRPGLDPVPIVTALFEAWKDQCRADGVARLSMVNCPADNEPLRRAALAAGAREFALPQAEWQLALERQTRFADHLQELNYQQRRNLSLDLKRPGDSGAEIVAVEPTAELMRQIWPLQLEYYRKRNLRFRPPADVNLFERIAARVPREHLEVLLCRRGEALLGFVLSYRAGRVAQPAYLGHVEDAELNVYVSLLAHALQRFLDGGATTVPYGFFGDAYKRRIGCRAQPRVQYYCPIDAGSPAT